MANTVKVKVKCVGLQPAAGSVPEKVTLEEMYDWDTTKHNTALLNQGPKTPTRWTFEIHPASGSTGQFKMNQAYVVSFLETT
jgi:hypothetical protein